MVKVGVAISRVLICGVAWLVAGWSLAQVPTTPPSPPKSEKELKVEKGLDLAKEKLAAGQWEAAIVEANKTLEIDATCNGAYLARGIAKRRQGNEAEAIKDLDLALAQGPRDTLSIYHRAQALVQKSEIAYEHKDYLKSIDNAYLATLEKGDYVDAHLQRAKAYVARQQWDKAIQSCNRAIQSNDKSAAAYSMRGLGYASKLEWDQALNDQKKAIELDAKYPEAYERRAVALANKGDLEGAFKDIEHALSLRPQYPEALADRGFLYGLQKEEGKAMADLDSALKLDPKCVQALMLKGLAAMKSEKYSKAIALFDQVATIQPRNAMAFSSRGFAKHGEEDYEGAVEDFTIAIELEPKLVGAYQGRAKAYGKLKRTELAQADQAMVRRLTPEPPPKLSKKKKEEAKKPEKEKELPKFVVQNKEVDPDKLDRALAMGKKIDQLVAANYAKHGVKPNPMTTDEMFVRRIYLDVTGTIPTYAQAMRFISSPDPNKRSKLIDQLLSSDGYSSHFFNYWADVLRYTDQLNSNVRGEPYRQWLKQSLAENKPWHRMVYEMITADGLIWENPATGYLQRDANMPLDNMNNTIRIFLGTRIGCAQCHNHPFDKWTQKEFYQIAAFTFGTVTSTHGGDKRYWAENPNERLKEEFYALEQEEEDRRNNYYRFERMLAFNQMVVNDQEQRKVTLPKDYAYDDGKPGEVVEPKVLFGKPVEAKPGEAPRKSFARWMVSKENPRFALTIANRLWRHAFGVGQIEPVDDMMDSTVAENPALMAYLEKEMKVLNFDMKEYLRGIYNSETYQREATREELQTGKPYHFQGPILRRMTAEQAWDSFVTLARPNPYDYRELPAHFRTSALGMDLNEVKVEKVLDGESKASAVDGKVGARQGPYQYKGVLVARASELPSPVPPNHFLRVFGQSDRELISASSTSGSVPQVLFMFNGPITHMLLEKDSTIYKNIVKKDDIRGGVNALFYTILSRGPTKEEAEVAVNEVRRAGAAGYGNVVWSLVNTREFLFVQ